MFEWIASNPEGISVGVVFAVAFFWLLREKFQSHKERINDLKESVAYYRDKAQEREQIIFKFLTERKES